MIRYYTTILMLFFISSSLLYNQNQNYNVPSKKKIEKKEEIDFSPEFEFLFTFSYCAASGFYDNNKNFITKLKDTTKFPGIDREFSFLLKKYTFETEFVYNISDDWSLSLYAPFTSHYLDETFIEYLDTVKMEKYLKERRAEYSLSHLDYLGLTATYSLFDDAFINKYFTSFKIPTSSIFNTDAEEVFWGNEAFEFFTGFIVGYSGEKSTIELETQYNYRDGDSDRLIASLIFTLHTVPDTKFYGFVESAYNIAKIDKDYKFDIHLMPAQDEYFDVGFGFEFIYDNHYLGDFNYRIRLDGRNTWNEIVYFMKFSYRF